MTSGARNVAGIRCIGVDRECVALDDGAGQIELRVLIPPAAGLEIRVGDERQQKEPEGKLAVGDAHRLHSSLGYE